MKTIIISLATLAAISTAALAGENRNNELRDIEYYVTNGVSAVQSDNAALAVGGSTEGLSAYERTLLIQQERDSGNR